MFFSVCIISIVQLCVFAWSADLDLDLDAKTKEIVFKRPNPRLSVHLATVTNIEQVRAAKLLLVLYCVTLCCLMNMFMPF